MPAMRTPNLYSYCLSLLLVLLAVTGHTWQPAHSELRLHAHREKQFPALSAELAICRPCGPQICIRIVWAFYLCYLLWLGILGSRPILSWDCMLTGRCAVKMKQIPALSAELAICRPCGPQICIRIVWAFYLFYLLWLRILGSRHILGWDCMLRGRCAVKMKQIPALSAELAICRPCRPQICIRIVWAFYLFYLLWLRMLGSRPILSWDCMLISWVGYMPAMRTPNLYSYCLSLLLVLLAVNRNTWQPAHSELRLHAHREKQFPALSAELAICRPCGPQICIRIVWAFYLCYLLWVGILGSRPILSWDCMLTGRNNFLRYQLSWLYAGHADPKFVFVLSEPSTCATCCDWAYLAAGPFWVEIACSICRPCGPQICIRIVWAFYLCYLLWLGILGSRPILSWDCMLTGRNNFLRYQLSWLYAGHADPKFVFVLSEPSTCATCCDWAYLAAGPFWVEIACSQADVLWRWNKFLRYQLSWLYAGHADPKFVFVLSEPSTCSTCCDWEYLAAGTFWVEIACSEADVLWRWNKFLRYQLSWLYAGHADPKFVFVLSEPSTCSTCCDWECLAAGPFWVEIACSSAELAICRPCGPQICIRIVWAFYLCYLLWLGILGSRPILSWDCLLTGRCAVKMKQIPALSAELAICRPCGHQICIRIVWAFYLFYLLWLRMLGSLPILGWDCMLTGRCAVKMKQIPALSAELAICQPCGPQICIRIVWAFYLFYLLWLRMLGSQPILSWDCMLTGRCAVKMKQIPALSAELAICQPCGPQICIRIVWAFYLCYLLWLGILGSRPILSWDCMLTGRCAVKMKQIPALSAELAICRPCGPQICIRIVWAFYLCYLLWLRIFGSQPILSWDCMLTGRCAVKMKQIPALSAELASYMPAMRTPNLYSYCLSLLLVLLAVTENTWQPAHSELRLLAQRQMCCEDETNSCVISWVGYMPAMRTSNLYSYCQSLLLVLLAVTENAWQPILSWDCMLTGRCAVKMKQIPALSAELAICQPCGPQICIRIVWAFYLFYLLWLRMLGSQPILSWDCMLTGRCAVKMKQIPALSAELAICRPCRPQICIRIVWAFYLFYLLWLRMLGSQPILSWDCMLTGRCAVKMKQIPALSAELAICRPCGPQICIRIVWDFYLFYLLWLRILGSRPILGWDCMLTGRCAVKMKQIPALSAELASYMPAMRTPNLYSYCLSLLLVLLAVTENTWQPAHALSAELASYMPAMRRPNLYSYCQSLLLVLLAVTENAWQPILSWDCMLRGRCAVKMKQFPALSAELAICRPCRPQICIRIVRAFYLFYLLWLRILGSRPILSWDCMFTGRWVM